MAKAKFGSTKRYGTRYGHTLRQRLGKIEESQKKKHPCPYCGYSQVRWQAVGIWNCRKCNATFAGRAYSPIARREITSQKREELVLAKDMPIKREE